MLSRRDMLKWLSAGAATSAAGLLLPSVLLPPEPEPVRRWWQVPRGKPQIDDLLTTWDEACPIVVSREAKWTVTAHAGNSGIVHVALSADGRHVVALTPGESVACDGTTVTLVEAKVIG